MICENCKGEIEDDSAFCFHCGTKVVKKTDKKYCIWCGSSIMPKTSICPKCGCENIYRLGKINDVSYKHDEINESQQLNNNQNFVNDSPNIQSENLVNYNTNFTALDGENVTQLQTNNYANSNVGAITQSENFTNQQMNNNAPQNNNNFSQTANDYAQPYDNQNVNYYQQGYYGDGVNAHTMDTQQKTKPKKNKTIVVVSIILAFVLICVAVITFAIKMSDDKPSGNIITSIDSSGGVSYSSYLSQVKQNVKSTGSYSSSVGGYKKEYNDMYDSSNISIVSVCYIIDNDVVSDTLAFGTTAVSKSSDVTVTTTIIIYVPNNQSSACNVSVLCSYSNGYVSDELFGMGSINRNTYNSNSSFYMSTYDGDYSLKSSAEDVVDVLINRTLNCVNSKSGIDVSQLGFYNY